MIRIQLFKRHPLEIRPWSNVYLIDADALAAGVAALAIIYDAETQFHNVATTFLSGLVSTVTEGDDVFQSVPLNSPGERPDPADNLPLWNTVRLLATVDGGGRPSSKFYRLPLGEGDVANYVINPTLASLIQTEMQDVVDDLAALGTPLVDPDGQAWATVSIQSRVQMRQLHRKRKRTAPPS